jgi:hypothetical protein
MHRLQSLPAAILWDFLQDHLGIGPIAMFLERPFGAVYRGIGVVIERVFPGHR